MNENCEKLGIPIFLSVGEVAKRSGVNVSTLHFYERKGLIKSTRTEGNQRRYNRKILRRVSIIRVAQKVGIPLASIKTRLDELPDNAELNRVNWDLLSSEWRKDLDKRITQLIKLRDMLDDCIGCGCLSMGQCQLRNPMDALAIEGTGPRRLLINSDAINNHAIDDNEAMEQN